MRSKEVVEKRISFNLGFNGKRGLFNAYDIGSLLSRLFASSRTGGQKPDQEPRSKPEPDQIIIDPSAALQSNRSFEDLESLLGDQPETQIEKWQTASRKTVDYAGGRRRVVDSNGTRYVSYEGGTSLYIIRDQKEELVMDTCEDAWCDETSKMALEGLELNEREPFIMVERGFGLGRIFDKNIARLAKIATQLADNGQEIPIRYALIELNQQIHDEDAKPRIDEVNKSIKEFNKARTKLGQKPIQLEIDLLLGDADKALEENFPPQSVDVIISDTHQFAESKRGLNDILKPDLLTSRLKNGKGRLLICAFHQKNQTGSIDPNQATILGQRFREIIIRRVKAVIPPHVTYYDRPEVEMPVVLCKNPINENGHGKKKKAA